MNCPNCNSQKIVKNGFVKEKQRYRCNDCKKNFRPSEPISYNKEKQAIQLYLEGLSPKWIAKLSKDIVTDVTIRNWVDKFGENPKMLRKNGKEELHTVKSVNDIPSEISRLLSRNTSKIQSGVLVIGLDIGNPFSYVLRIENEDIK